MLLEKMEKSRYQRVKMLEKISLPNKISLAHAFEETVIEAERAFFIKVYHKYQALLSVQNLYDFDDLITRVIALFEKDETVRPSVPDML